MKKVMLPLLLLSSFAYAIDIPKEFIDEEKKMVPHQFQVHCANTKDILTELKDQYHEDLYFIGGMTHSELETIYTSLWGNEDTGTWTVVVTNKDEGKSCVTSSGHSFQYFANKGESF